MGNQFKIGDLALTLVDRGEGLFGWPAMTTVELIAVYHPGDVIEQVHKTATAIETVWECAAKASDTLNYLYRPHELMPLRGGFEPEQQKQREAAPCA